MGSDESHFNVSLIVRDKVTRQCPQTTTLLKIKESRSRFEPRSFRLPARRLTTRPNRLTAAHVHLSGLQHSNPGSSTSPWPRREVQWNGQCSRGQFSCLIAAHVIRGWKKQVTHASVTRNCPSLPQKIRARHSLRPSSTRWARLIISWREAQPSKSNALSQCRTTTLGTKPCWPPSGFQPAPVWPSLHYHTYTQTPANADIYQKHISLLERWWLSDAVVLVFVLGVFLGGGRG